MAPIAGIISVAFGPGFPDARSSLGLAQKMDSTPPHTPPRWSKVVTVLLALVLVALVLWGIYEIVNTTRAMGKYELESESSRLASNMYFSKLTALAQLTVGLLGGAWALVTVVDTSVKMKGWPTIACFTVANLSFLLSLAIYAYGYDFIVARIFHHATFDIDAPFISFVSRYQQALFANGCIDLAFTVAFGRKVP